MAINLRYPIRTTGIERRRLGLRTGLRLAEHLRSRRLIETYGLGIDMADRFQDLGDPDAIDLAGVNRSSNELPTKL